MSAGFASVFGTPIAGALFGIEVLFIGGMLYQVLVPSFIAATVSFYVTSALGEAYFYHPLCFQADIASIFTDRVFVFVILSGIFFGFCSLLFIEVMNFFKKLSGKIRAPACVNPLIGGAALILLGLVFSDSYLGLGLDTIEKALAGGSIVWYAFIMKIIFTSITLNFVVSGGVTTPIFFIGATSGLLFSRFFGLDPALFSAIGFAASLLRRGKQPRVAFDLIFCYNQKRQERKQS